MTATPPITLEWLNSDASRLKAYNISSDALAMINKSETLKADIRAYAASASTTDAILHTKAGAGSYTAPAPGTRFRIILFFSSYW